MNREEFEEYVVGIVVRTVKEILGEMEPVESVAQGMWEELIKAEHRRIMRKELGQ